MFNMLDSSWEMLASPLHSRNIQRKFEKSSSNDANTNKPNASNVIALKEASSHGTILHSEETGGPSFPFI